jgi:hypothetical protein
LDVLCIFHHKKRFFYLTVVMLAVNKERCAPHCPAGTAREAVLPGAVFAG